MLERFFGPFIMTLGKIRVDPHFALLLAFSLFALTPLTAPGYFVFAHDARHSVYFLQMFDQSVRDGAWFPRWAADMVFGYGYPLWLILAPLPFFAGEAFHLVGFDFVSSVKIVDGLAILFSSITMYLFASRILGRNAALVSALAYIYIPYHLVDLYVRAAQAELISFVFPPLVLWAFHRLAETNQARYAPIAALAYAGLLLAHISMAVIFTPIIGLYILFLLFQVAGFKFQIAPRVFRFAFHSILAIALSIGIAAIFLLPVFFEKPFLTDEPLTGGFFSYQKHFLNASQLFSTLWGYGYAGENGTDQFSLQLGLVPILLAFAAIYALRSTRDSIRAHIAFFAVLTVAIIFATLPISSPIWSRFASIVAFVQFPWRLLIVTSLTLAFLSGAAMHAFSESNHDLLPTLAVAMLFVTASYPYTEPQHTDAVFNYQTQMEFEVKYGELLGDTIWMKGERPKSSPLVEQYTSGQPLQKAVALDEGARVETIRHGGQSDDIRIDTPVPARVMIYTRYFPGWAATLDGAPIAIEPSGDQGLIATRDPVPPGQHLLQLRFQDTPIRQIGGIISALSLLIAFVWIRRARNGKKE